MHKLQEHELFFSLASLLELSIKIRKSKIRWQRTRSPHLPVRYEDVLTLEHLYDHHSDPFDRILVAQAIANGLKLLMEDEDMKLYPVQTVW